MNGLTAEYITFGCKVNRYETEQIRETLEKIGFASAQGGDPDVVVVNSCTVTAESTAKVRRELHRLRRDVPSACIVLTGCLPQAFPEEAASLTEADIVIGNASNEDLPSLVSEFLSARRRIVRVQAHKKGERFAGDTVKKMTGQTRAFIKIQDGCDRFCSYCIIPYARGRQRSKPLDELQKELFDTAGAGYSEVVLTGINLTSYGRGEGFDLADAVAAAGDAGFARVRLGSLEPDSMSDEMLSRLSRTDSFCPHFHPALQSGSDRILKSMNRRYTVGEYRDLVRKLREFFPDCGLTTDVIVGFPGEDESDFAATVKLCEEISFDKVHVFPFSAREGTRAAQMPGRVTNAVKADRCARLSKTCSIIRENIFSSRVGKTVSVLFETPEDGFNVGYARDYSPVRAAYDLDRSGTVCDVLVESFEKGEYLYGAVIPSGS